MQRATRHDFICVHLAEPRRDGWSRVSLLIQLILIPSKHKRHIHLLHDRLPVVIGDHHRRHVFEPAIGDTSRVAPDELLLRGRDGG